MLFLMWANAPNSFSSSFSFFFFFFFYHQQEVSPGNLFDTNLDCLISRPPAQLLSWDFPSSVFCIKPLFPEFYVFPFLDLLGWSKFAMCPEKGCVGDITDAVDAQPHSLNSPEFTCTCWLVQFLLRIKLR